MKKYYERKLKIVIGIRNNRNSIKKENIIGCLRLFVELSSCFLASLPPEKSPGSNYYLRA
jgi:hypothetical protein